MKEKNDSCKRGEALTRGKVYVNKEKNVYPGAGGWAAYDAFRIL